MPISQKNQLSGGKKIVFSIVFYSFLVLLGGFVFGFGLLLVRTVGLYNFIKSNEHGFEGKIFRYDPELGHAPVPDSRGAQIFPIGPEVPVRFDHNGFRVPLNEAAASNLKRPMTLALGCSYTFGAACPAEKTFVYLTGKELNGSSLNAGVPGYGLSQMLILAHRLIPQYQPDFVLVQYSPWLVDRAMEPFAPSWVGVLPSPFLTDSAKGGMEIYPPVFRTKSFDLDISSFRHTNKNFADFLSFLADDGLPLYLHDGLYMSAYYAKRLSGTIPRPRKAPERIVEFVYNEIYQECQGNNSRMVIVVLTEPDSPRKPSSAEISKLNDLGIIVNGWSALLARLPDKNFDRYEHAYRHYRGENAVLVDKHPNEKAHQIIAEEIIKMTRNY